MSNDKIKEMNNIIKTLNEASQLYYNDKTPIMTDKQWDDLFDKLKQIEKETGITLSNSPSINVGYEVISKLSKVEHSIPLRSLDKTKSIDELNKFTKGKESVLMLKGDGLTNEIIYNDGILIQGSTRGNSIIGEDISHNVKVYKNIPLKINYKGYLKLAGESVILDEDFIKINEKENGKYSNSRNLVAGSVRQLDSKICAERHVNFFAFNILECDENLITVEDQFIFLKSLGFEIIPYIIVNFIKQEDIDNMKNIAKTKGIPIDGLVTKFNDVAYGNSLGETGHHPLNAIAFKFYDESSETTYIRTEWTTSRTGLLNPVGIFEPTEVSGSTIERATLHNVDYFEELQLGASDIVEVIKSNDIIPKIIGNSTRSNTETIPNECPVCKSKTEIKLMKTARVLYCTNDNCPSKKIAEFEHFCGRDAMNILGVSTAILQTFIDKGFIKTIPDLYKLEQYKKEIVKLEGFGLKSYNKIIEGINNSKKCKLENFIFGLGIPQIGKGSSKILAKHFKDIDSFLNAMSVGYNFSQIEDIGEITSKAIIDWWMPITTTEMVCELLQYIEFETEEVKQSNSSVDLTGKIFVITGGVHIYKNRDEIKAKIESLGGKASGSVSKKTSYLICNEPSNTGKYKDATDLNIPILTEEDFQKLIGE